MRIYFIGEGTVRFGPGTYKKCPKGEEPGQEHIIEVAPGDEGKARVFLGMNTAKELKGNDGLNVPLDSEDILPSVGRSEMQTYADHLRKGLPPATAGCPMWVVVPTRNRPEHAVKQVNKLLAQGPEAVVLINDGGSGIVGLPEDGRLSYVKLGKPRGPNGARNVGISLSPKDALIVEIDDHDFVEEGALGAIRKAFESKETWVVYGDCWRCNSAGDKLPNGSYFEKGEYVPKLFKDKGALHLGMRAYRRAAYDAIGGYRQSETPGGDYGVFLRIETMLDSKGIVHLPRPLCTVTKDMSGISRRLRSQQAEVCRRLKLAADCGSLFATDEEIRKSKDPSRAYTKVPEPPAPDYSKVKETVLREFSGNVCGEVIAVVPTFQTGKHMLHCMDNLATEGVPVVVVDDACPENSGNVAVRHKHGDVEVVRLSSNCGFARAVNVGVQHALKRKPEAVLILNADAFLGDGSVGGMLRALRADDGVAVVGNTHTGLRGDLQSQGSEWNWKSQCYRHVGRDEADPIDGDPPKERDMVTFACAMVRTEDWVTLKGLDERFRKAYWEDADFCMRVREAGRKIIWSGLPHTVHVCGASHGRKKGPYEENKRLFQSRWSDSGKVDKFAKERGLKPHDVDVVGAMIVCEEEEFVAASIESAGPLMDRLVVAVGGTEAGAKAGLCGKDGLPRDKTLDILRDFERSGKVELILPPGGKPWPHKKDMREATIRGVKDGEWVLVLDADEVWSEDGLWRLSRHMHSADAIACNHWTIWNKLDTAGTEKWDQYPECRAIRWRDGYTWMQDDNRVHNKFGKALGAMPRLHMAILKRERLYVHYSWVRPLDKIRRKVDYYRHKPGVATRPRPTYFEDVFLGWRKNSKRVEKEFGTHPMGGGGTRLLPCPHPPSVQRLIDGGLIGGEGW